MSDTEINDRLAQLRKGFQERGFEAFEELCETDPETYALVLAEAACRLEEEGVHSVEADQTDGPRPLQVCRKKGESVEKALARYWTKPELRAADSIQRLSVIGGQSVGLDELLRVLEEQASLGDSGCAAAMLSAQAHILDALFHNLLRRAQANISGGYPDTGKGYLKLAIRTQFQSRATLDALTALDKLVIKQANIAHRHQQVNNYSEKPPNELLAEENDQGVDAGAPSEAIRRWKPWKKSNGAKNDRRRG